MANNTGPNFRSIDHDSSLPTRTTTGSQRSLWFAKQSTVPFSHAEPCQVVAICVSAAKMPADMQALLWATTAVFGILWGWWQEQARRGSHAGRDWIRSTEQNQVSYTHQLCSKEQLACTGHSLFPDSLHAPSTRLLWRCHLVSDNLTLQRAGTCLALYIKVLPTWSTSLFQEGSSLHLSPLVSNRGPEQSHQYQASYLPDLHCLETVKCRKGYARPLHLLFTGSHCLLA